MTVQLKAFKNGKWWLLPGVEFTPEELEPLEKNMERAGVAILEAGETVGVPVRNFTKEQVLQILQSC